MSETAQTVTPTDEYRMNATQKEILQTLRASDRRIETPSTLADGLGVRRQTIYRNIDKEFLIQHPDVHMKDTPQRHYWSDFNEPDPPDLEDYHLITDDQWENIKQRWWDAKHWGAVAIALLLYTPLTAIYPGLTTPYMYLFFLIFIIVFTRWYMGEPDD